MVSSFCLSWYGFIPSLILSGHLPFWRCDKILTNVLSFNVAVHISVEDTLKHFTPWDIFFSEALKHFYIKNCLNFDQNISINFVWKLYIDLIWFKIFISSDTHWSYHLLGCHTTGINSSFKTFLKLLSAIFYQTLIFSQNNSTLKTMKNIFYFI